jgi:hypothetical protein
MAIPVLHMTSALEDNPATLDGLRFGFHWTRANIANLTSYQEKTSSLYFR